MIALNATKEPIGKLDPEPWLTAPETVKVMDALTVDGADVRFVGGCVRDGLAKQPVKDIDIGTPDTPDRVIELLARQDIRSIPTGIEHGTVTAVVGNRTFEITTLREDVEPLGRRAVVAFTDDWIVDSSRRDFTINAMSATRAGDVYDYHEGIPDLAHGRIRFVGRATDRVQEDYLRILRCFRFYARFGRPSFDPEAFNACRQHAAQLSTISAERIREELLGILSTNDPAATFTIMRDAGVLDVVLPEATNIGRLRTKAWLASRGLVIDGLQPDAVRRLAAVLSSDADAADVSRRLRLSNRESARLADILALTPLFAEPPSVEETKRLIHAHGNEAVADAALVAWASRLAEHAKLPRSESTLRRADLETAFEWTPPTFPVGGQDAQKLGLARGPKIGTALRRVEDWWADDGFTADREACLRKLESVIGEIKETST